MKVILLSFCDGIGCARLALEWLHGPPAMSVAWETDPECVRITSERFPETVHRGCFVSDNYTEVARLVRDADPGAECVVLVTAGTPCPDFSVVAGKTEGRNLPEGAKFSEFVDRVETLEKELPYHKFLVVAENVVMNDPSDSKFISERLKTEPVVLDAADASLVSQDHDCGGSALGGRMSNSIPLQATDSSGANTTDIGRSSSTCRSRRRVACPLGAFSSTRTCRTGSGPFRVSRHQVQTPPVGLRQSGANSRRQKRLVRDGWRTPGSSHHGSMQTMPCFGEVMKQRSSHHVSKRSCTACLGDGPASQISPTGPDTGCWPTAGTCSRPSWLSPWLCNSQLRRQLQYHNKSRDPHFNESWTWATLPWLDRDQARGIRTVGQCGLAVTCGNTGRSPNFWHTRRW